MNDDKNSFNNVLTSPLKVNISTLSAEKNNKETKTKSNSTVQTTKKVFKKK